MLFAIVEFMLNKGWNVYEHLPYANLGLISNSNDERILNSHYLWAAKPDCSFIKIIPINDEGNIFNYEIVGKEQLNIVGLVALY